MSDPIERVLPADLADAYVHQLSAVRDAIRGLEADEALLRLRRTMEEHYQQVFHVSAENAKALSALASEPPSTNVPALPAVSRRLALQRALAQKGVAGELGAYLEAAAAGAREAEDVAAGDVVFREGRKDLIRLRRASLRDAGGEARATPSRYFLGERT